MSQTRTAPHANGAALPPAAPPANPDRQAEEQRLLAEQALIDCRYALRQIERWGDPRRAAEALKRIEDRLEQIAGG